MTRLPVNVEAAEGEASPVEAVVYPEEGAVAVFPEAEGAAFPAVGAVFPVMAQPRAAAFHTVLGEAVR